MKHSLFLFFSALIVFSSCNKEEETQSTSEQAPKKTENFTQEIDDINDKVGILSNAFLKIEKELQAAAENNKNLKNTKLSVREDFTIVLENFSNGHEIYEVDIRKLDRNNTRLISEEEGDGFPGFALGSIGYENIVQKSLDGTQQDPVNEFPMVFDNRERVGKVVPLFIQCINIAKGEYDQYYN